MKRTLYIILLGIILSLIISFLYSYKEQQKLSQEMKNYIDEIFGNTDRISDGESSVIWLPEYINYLDKDTDKDTYKNILKRFPRSEEKKLTMVAKPLLKGFSYVMLEKRQKNVMSQDDFKYISSEEKNKLFEIEYRIVSCVSSEMISYDNNIDRNKERLSKYLGILTENCFNYKQEEYINSYNMGKYEGITNFGKFKNQYYYFDYAPAYYYKDALYSDQWCEFKNKYNLLLSESSGFFKLKENSHAIFIDKLKFFGISLCVYFLCCLLIYLVIKIIKG